MHKYLTELGMLYGGQSSSAVSLQNVSRRNLLITAGAGFAVAAFWGQTADAFEPYLTGAESMSDGVRSDPLIFVSLESDGTVTIISHRSEMGQGVRTSLPMVLADEMGADWSRVKIKQAEGDEPKYGNQDTDGSRSLRHHIQPMRQMGAAVRQMLVNAAAKRWGVEAIEVTVGVHELTAGENKAGFGELAEEAMAQPVPALNSLSFITEEEFRYIGKGDIGIYDLPDIVTGKAVYGADVILPGMKVAVIARPPVVGASLVSHDSSRAMAVVGVEQVVELEGSIMPAQYAPLGGVAIIASHTDAAIKGRDALEIVWGDSPHGQYDSEAFFKQMRETAGKPGKVLRQEGNPQGAFSNAAKVLVREYTQEHMAHAMMEPPVALADVRSDGTAEIWAPLQSPHVARTAIAQALKLDPANVRVNVTLLGGGFGRKSKCDFAIEAALLSQKLGSPVRVQWTREDDIQHSFYATTSVERLEAAIDESGKVTGWRHNSVAPSFLTTFAPDSGYQFVVENGQGHVEIPFNIPNISIENGPALAHTRVGWFRSVSNIPRAWAVQSFVSELANELGRDDLDMMLEMIGRDRIIDPKQHGFPESFWNYGEPEGAYPIDTARLKNVLRIAADKINWGRQLPEGEGLGLAVHRSFLSYVACAVRVKIIDGLITVPEVQFAIDCGFAANPERIRSQIEGACVMGMGVALYSGITFENGRVQQSNFHDYEMVRADNFPIKTNVHIVEHPFSMPAAGVGEPGIPPVPPAIANAIFHATGTRFRHAPFGETIET